MRCAEFECRLNDVLDDRLEPALDELLVDHAQQCSSCADQLSAYELLLDGVRSLPRVSLHADSVSKSIVANLAVLNLAVSDSLGAEGLDASHVVPEHPVQPAGPNPNPLLTKRRTWSSIGIGVVAAAIAMIVALPWLQQTWFPGPAVPEGVPVAKDPIPSPPSIPVANDIRTIGPHDIGPRAVALHVDTLRDEPIAWVGYYVADGMKPVASSMVSALNALKKRPLLWLDDDINRRSSSFEPAVGREAIV